MPQAKQLGWDARADEREDDRLLRESLLTALSIHSDGDWMLRQARPRARAFMDGEHSDGGPIALWVAARHGEIGFDALMTAYREAQGPRRIPFVRAMGALAGPAFDEVLAAIAAGEIRGQDVIYIADVASKWSDSRARLTDWMRDNLAPLAERIPGFGVARMMGVLGRICEPARRDAARATFEPIVARLGGTGRRLDMALDAADLCIDLRRRQTDAVTSYLLARRRF